MMKFSRKPGAYFSIFLLLLAAGALFFYLRGSDKPQQSAQAEVATPLSGPDATPVTQAAQPVKGTQPDISESGPLQKEQENTHIASEPAPEEAIVANACALVLGQATLVNANRLLEHAYYAGWSRPSSGILCTEGVFKGIVEKGDTLAGVLEDVGGESQSFVQAASKIFPLRSFREGQPYSIEMHREDGRIKRFEYEINDSRRLVVDGLDKPRARVEPIEYDTILEACEGVINDSLFQAVADIGESPQLALRLVDMFGSEINFIRDIQEGDSFSALVEKRYRDGEYKGYGRIIAATFTCKGKTYEAFLFNDGSSKPQYFNAKGENLHKTLLQAPLAITRITSRFSHNRKHPILGKSRPHLGVDYGAPTGTPVKAVGDGTVTKKGWAGGYGNQIIIAHSSGLESMYAHLSGFSRGIKQGQKVRQGQVIGFVGSTGLSTGPHLDFRLRQNGKFINPVKAINPRGAPVASGKMRDFKRNVELCRGYLSGKVEMPQYTVDSIVPLAVLSVQPEAVKKEKARAKAPRKIHKKAVDKKRAARSTRRR